MAESPLKTGTFAFVWFTLCVLLSAIGLMIRAMAVGHAAPATSGRNTMCQRAASLNTTGIYSIVRHPLYLGNFLIMQGFLFTLGVWWLGVLGTVIFWLYYERIMLAEEDFLEAKFGQTFRAWADQTPTFIPNPRLWHKPDRPLFVRRVIRNEYTTLMLLAMVFIGIQAAEWLCIMRLRTHPWGWLLGITLAAVALYLITRFCKKRTRLLAID